MICANNFTLNTKEWSIGGLAITAKNALHPIVQEFFSNMGAKISVKDDDWIHVTGNFMMNQNKFEFFLLSNGIDLRNNPEALNWPVHAAIINNNEKVGATNEVVSSNDNDETIKETSAKTSAPISDNREFSGLTPGFLNSKKTNTSQPAPGIDQNDENNKKAKSPAPLLKRGFLL